MFTYKVIGYRSFVSKKTKKEWVEIYCTYPSDGIIGLGCERFFCQPGVIQGKLELGKQVIPSFRRNSDFIESLQVV